MTCYDYYNFLTKHDKIGVNFIKEKNYVNKGAM